MSTTPTLIVSQTDTFMGILLSETTPTMDGGYSASLALRPFSDEDEVSIENIFKEYKNAIIQIEIKQFELIAPDTRGGQVWTEN